MLNPASIVFPVYAIKEHEKIKYGSQGAVFIFSKQEDIYILDDKSLPGSFPERRLKLKFKLAEDKYFKLYRLNTSLSNWHEFLAFKNRNKSKTYIDSEGKIFKYKPTTPCEVKYFKVLKVEAIANSRDYFLVLDGLPQKLKTTVPPPDEYSWVGVIFSTVGNLIYTYADRQLKDTWIKV